MDKFYFIRSWDIYSVQESIQLAFSDIAIEELYKEEGGEDGSVDGIKREYVNIEELP